MTALFFIIISLTQGEAKEWTPYNAEMNLTGIKVSNKDFISPGITKYSMQVLVKNPMPEKVKRDGSFEDTMMLLEMIKEKQQKENKQLKACFKFSAL